MTTPTESSVLAALRGIRDPDQGQDIVSLGMVKDLQIRDAEVSFTLAFAGQAPATKAALHSAASKAVSQLPGVSRVSVKMGGAAGAGRAPAPAAFRDAKTREYREMFANPYVAAERGYVDEVIEPRDTRARLCAALELVRTKRDANPPKKHGNIPL